MGRNDVAVITGEGDNQRAHGFRQRVAVRRVVRHAYFGDTLNGGGGIGGGLAVFTGHQNINLAELTRGRDRVERGALDRGIVVIGND